LIKLKGNAMSHTLTQPEEIEIVLLDLAADAEAGNERLTLTATEARYKAWYASYIPPYRAAYQAKQMTGI
jgi:hypothetical protein